MENKTYYSPEDGAIYTAEDLREIARDNGYGEDLGAFLYDSITRFDVLREM